MSLETAIILVAEYAFLGGSIKYIDQVYDEKIWSRAMAVILAVVSGLLMGYLVATDPASAAIFIAIVLGVALAKKIDNLPFMLGTLLVLGAPALYLTFVSQLSLNWGILFFLTMAGLFDEWGNDLYDQKKITGPLGRFFAYRSTMKLAVFAMPLLGVFSWSYFFAFLAFDISYVLIDWFSQPYIVRKKTAAPEIPVKFGRRWYDKFVVWRWHEIQS